MVTGFPTNAWYAVGSAQGLLPGSVMAATVHGVEMAVWRTASGKAQAFNSRCPHRGMRLTYGFVRGEQLACIYHGWHYEGSGHCALIPAHPTLNPPKTICATTYGLAERDGLLWVAAEAPAEAGGPGVAIGPDAAFCRTVYLDIPADRALAHMLGAVFPPGGLASGGPPVEPVAAGVEDLEVGETGRVYTVTWDGRPARYASERLGPGVVRVTATDADQGSTTIVAALQPVSDARTGLHVLVGARNGAADRMSVSRWVERLRWFTEHEAEAADGYRPWR
jgi:nitrite reductase/ring-hydroxylating ferredoxin subunit